MGFYRLSMSIQCAAILTSPAGGMPPVAPNSFSPGSDEVASCVNDSMFKLATERTQEDLTKDHKDLFGLL